MKSRALMLTVATLFILAGCGGGGGGGGGGGLRAPAAVNWSPPNAPFNGGTGATLTNATDVFSVDGRSMSATTGMSGFSVTKTADGLTLTTGSGLTRSVSLSASAGDFTNTAGNFITATKDSYGRFTDNTNASYRARDTIVLGGEKLGLSYSEFGLWASYERIVTDGESADGGSAVTGTTPFYMGDSDKRTGFSAASSQTFSGTTAAVATGGGMAGSLNLTGTASLTMSGSTNSGSLALNFSGSNFYTFTTAVNVGAGGAISQAGIATVSGTDTTGSGMSAITGMANTTINGQFYGAASGTPTEAAGQYFMQSNHAIQYVTIQGGFGVK